MSRSLEDLTDSCRAKYHELEQACEKHGVEFIVTFTSRTFGEQCVLYMQGRQPLDRVNKARADVGWAPITQKQNKRPVTWTLSSKHVVDEENPKSRAFDVAIVHDGKVTWDLKADFDKDGISDYLEVGHLGEAVGMKWGGRFTNSKGKPIPDYAHFEEY